MVFENIEKLKRDLTDKYVVVDESLPELKRFGGLTGTVKTVNYSGRALVQFDGYNNIGWFDIDPQFLKIIEAPLPKPVKEEKAEKKAAPAKAEKAPANPTAPKQEGKPAATGSVADILAAARAKPGAAPPAAKVEAAPKAEATKPAAEASKPAGKVDPAKLSVADMLAMARGKSAAPAATPAPAAPAKAAPVKAAPPAAKPEPAPEPVEQEPVAAKPVKSAGALPKDTAGMVAYCRQTDGK